MQGPVKMVARGMGVFACGMHGIWGNGYGGHRKMRGGAWMSCGHTCLPSFKSDNAPNITNM